MFQPLGVKDCDSLRMRICLVACGAMLDAQSRMGDA